MLCVCAGVHFIVFFSAPLPHSLYFYFLCHFLFPPLFQSQNYTKCSHVMFLFSRTVCVCVLFWMFLSRNLQHFSFVIIVPIVCAACEWPPKSHCRCQSRQTAAGFRQNSNIIIIYNVQNATLSGTFNNIYCVCFEEEDVMWNVLHTNKLYPMASL